MMFHNKGEADDHVHKLHQAFLFLALQCCLSQFPTTDFCSPPMFHFVTLHTSRSLIRQSYLTLITLLTLILWQITQLRFTAIFRHRHSDTKTLLKRSPME